MRLDVAGERRKLVGYDLIGDEGLAEGVALGGVIEGVGETGSRLAVAPDGHDEALFIEVLHDDGEAVVFFAEEVGHGDVDVVELDEAGAAGFLAAVGDAAVGEALGGGGDDEHGDAGGPGAARADGGRHVGGPREAGDPFFVTVDDVVGAVFGFDGGGLDVGDVGLLAVSQSSGYGDMDTYTTTGLGDTQTKRCLPCEEPREPFLLLFLRTIMHNRGHSDYAPTRHCYRHAALNST